MFKYVYATLFGAWAAQVELYPAVEKYGFVGLATFLVWWIVNRLARQMDMLLEKQERVANLLTKIEEKVDRYGNYHENQAQHQG